MRIIIDSETTLSNICTVLAKIIKAVSTVFPFLFNRKLYAERRILKIQIGYIFDGGPAQSTGPQLKQTKIRPQLFVIGNINVVRSDDVSAL